MVRPVGVWTTASAASSASRAFGIAALATAQAVALRMTSLTLPCTALTRRGAWGETPNLMDPYHESRDLPLICSLTHLLTHLETLICVSCITLDPNGEPSHRSAWGRRLH